MTNADYFKYEKLIYKIANRYMSNQFLKNYDLEDLVQVGTIGLLNGFDKYDENKKANRVTFYARCIENEINKEIQRNKTIKRYLNTCKDYLQENISEDNENTLESNLLNEKAITDKIIDEEEDEYIISQYYDAIYDTLDGQQRYLLLNNLFYEESTSNIAESENMKVETVRRSIQRAKRKLIRDSEFIKERKRLVLDAYINYYAAAEKVAMKEII